MLRRHATQTRTGKAMKLSVRVLSILLIASSMGNTIRGEEWATLGSRQMGMGGAGVASTRGALSFYWNPAGLAPPKAPRVDSFWDLALPVSVNAGAIGDVLDNVDDISELVDNLGDFGDLENRLDDPAQLLNDQELQDAIRILAEELPQLDADGVGLVSNASVALAARVKYFGFSALALASAGGVTNLDLQNIALGDEGIAGVIGAGNDRTGALTPEGQAFADSLASAGLATQNQAEEIVFQAEQAGVGVADPAVQQNIQNILQSTQDNIGGDTDSFFSQNGSGVDLRGILVQEYGVSFAYPFLELISVGATAKLMYGSTFFEPFTLSTIEDSADLAEDLFDSENMEESLNFGIDVGVLVQPVEWLSFGVVGRNLNRPEFDFDGPGKYVLEPQIRAGAALRIPETGLTLAVDVDVLENNSESLLGYETRTIGGGLEYALFDAVMLRGGVSKNLSESDESLSIHGGVGFRIATVHIEIAASMSPEFTEVDGNDIPERAGASVFIGINVPLE